MIPKLIHYCWFGHSPMPDIAEKCIRSWHRNMPEWEYKLWNEDNFDVNSTLYTKEAYESKKYAFVSDYVRLKALWEEGGVYLDTDVEVFKSFDDLLRLNAFGGFEGSKQLPFLTCVFGSAPRGEWVSEQLSAYQDKTFYQSDGTLDLTTNVQIITKRMSNNGFIQNGKKQQYKDLTVFPVEWFCPRLTTGEYIKTNNTYCDHLGIGSWIDNGSSWKAIILKLFGQSMKVKIIKIKRRLLG